MSLAMVEYTKEDVQKAYELKSIPKMGKETLYVFDRVVHFMLGSFKNRIKGITFAKNEIDLDKDYLLSEKNLNHLLKTLEFISEISLPISDTDFGKMKVDIEQWYYRMGGEGMYFEYQEEYLLTPKEASDRLGISNVTLHKYTKQGLEIVDTTSHRKIPIHAIELLKDPVYSIRMQMLSQEKKVRNQTLDDRLKEVRDGIIEMQKKYKAKTVQEAMIFQGITHMDVMDDPSDFRNWEDLENEQENILDEMIGGEGHV